MLVLWIEGECSLDRDVVRSCIGSAVLSVVIDHHGQPLWTAISVIEKASHLNL